MVCAMTKCQEGKMTLCKTRLTGLGVFLFILAGTGCQATINESSSAVDSGTSEIPEMEEPIPEPEDPPE